MDRITYTKLEEQKAYDKNHARTQQAGGSPKLSLQEGRGGLFLRYSLELYYVQRNIQKVSRSSQCHNLRCNQYHRLGNSGGREAELIPQGSGSGNPICFFRHFLDSTQ